MNLSLVSKLKKIIEEGVNKERIRRFEDVIIESIDEFVKEDVFYELPTNEILKIIKKSEIENAELLYEIISRMCAIKGEDSTLLLNIIKREEAPLEECLKFLSKFEYCQLCQRTTELLKEEKDLPERDFELEIEELKRINEELQKKKKEVEKKTIFSPVTEKPSDFESDIFKAAREGKLTSMQYLIEQCHVDPEIKDDGGRTSIFYASGKGYLEVVEYLYETYHVNVETKDKHECTPIFYASGKGCLEVVQYLYEECHANVETKNNDSCTPLFCASGYGHLDVVKYLYEQCHADVEAKNKDGRTPILFASVNGHFEVVKYLCETCHAEITEETIERAKTEEIYEYLRSKH